MNIRFSRIIDYNNLQAMDNCIIDIIHRCLFLLFGLVLLDFNLLLNRFSSNSLCLVFEVVQYFHEDN